MKAKDRIIVALDVPTLQEAEVLVKQLASHVGIFKVGLQLITAEGGLRVASTLSDVGGRVMYDGKFLDIPNTIVGAVEAMNGPSGIAMFTIHASGGEKMMRDARRNLGDHVKMLAVTVLTSISEQRSFLTFGASAKAKVIQFADWAKNAGAYGVVCSGQELSVLAEEEKLKDLARVVPGIRPKWVKKKDDQSRKMTPGEAIKAGADYVMIGRPITKPPQEIGSPVNAAKKIAEEIQQALEKKGD